MSQPPKRLWRPRFSLKTFLLFCLLSGGGVAWVSHSYREYVTEQKLIETFAKRLPPGSLITVDTNGHTTSLAGGRFVVM